MTTRPRPFNPSIRNDQDPPILTALIRYCIRDRAGRPSQKEIQPESWRTLNRWTGVPTRTLQDYCARDNWADLRRQAKSQETPIRFLRAHPLAAQYRAEHDAKLPSHSPTVNPAPTATQQRTAAHANGDDASSASTSRAAATATADTERHGSGVPLGTLTHANREESPHSERGTVPVGTLGGSSRDSDAQQPRHMTGDPRHITATDARELNERRIRQKQEDRLKRLESALDNAITESAHDAGKMKQAIDAAARLHELERQMHNIEDKPPETRAVALLPDMVTAEAWQARQAARPQDENASGRTN